MPIPRPPPSLHEAPATDAARAAPSTGRAATGSGASAARIVRRPVPPLDGELHPDALAHRVLAARGITSRDELDFALARLPLPDALPNIEAAVARLLAAREASERVLVVGDYDCDGATSVAAALTGLGMLGFADVEFLVPNRVEFGYGLSVPLVELAAERHAPDLILTVDNGTSSIEGVARARELGVDVVVTDHHLPGRELPRARAIVNPNLEGSRFETGRLAGVGVLFYLLLALRARCRATGRAGGGAPLADLLDLVAIGTVADVVALDRVNRTLVEQGLRRIRAGRTRPGVLALIEVAGRDRARLAPADIGFAIGPRLNAAGRIADMREGVLCLLAPDMAEARVLAKELDRMNGERRRIEEGMRNEADARLAASAAQGSDALVMPDAQDPEAFGLVLHDPGWHEGVVGILAGRLKERWHRPAAVCTTVDGGRIKGSVRSIAEVHARDVLVAIAARAPGLLAAFGGHAMAAGFTLEPAGLDAFRSAFDAEVRRVLGDRLPTREWLTDGQLGPGQLDLAHARLLRGLAPWGQGFELPAFDGTFRVVTSRTVGNGHLKLTVRPEGPEGDVPDEAGAARSPVLDAIAFRRDDRLVHGDRIRLVYELDVNVYRDEERLQLMVRHLERAGT